MAAQVIPINRQLATRLREERKALRARGLRISDLAQQWLLTARKGRTGSILYDPESGEYRGADFSRENAVISGHISALDSSERAELLALAVGA